MNHYFLSDQDFEYIQQIAEDFLEVVGVPIFYYRIYPEKTAINLYGEAAQGKKFYNEGLKMKCLIRPEEQQVDFSEFGQDVKRNVTFGFLREILKAKNLYPEPGDIIEFDNQYYEVANVEDNMLLGSRHFFKHAIVCQTHWARDSNINIIKKKNNIDE